jgi:hypothetical protein
LLFRETTAIEKGGRIRDEVALTVLTRVEKITSLNTFNREVPVRTFTIVAMALLFVFGGLPQVAQSDETKAKIEEMKGEANSNAEKAKGEMKGAAEDAKGNKVKGSMERAKGKTKAAGEKTKGKAKELKAKTE